MLKKLFVTVTALVIFLSLAVSANAQDKSVNLYLFWGDGCPHCAKEKEMLGKVLTNYPTVRVYEYEVWKSEKNRQLLLEVGRKLNEDSSGVPFTIIGDEVFVGFNESVTANQIQERLKYCTSNQCPDSVAQIVNVSGETVDNNIPQDKQPESNTIKIPNKITFPIIGDIQTKNLSLPLFTIVIAALDGFNPCAMWTLLFLITLLLGMENKRRRWILGVAFIASSAFVYFLFMAAWLNILVFIGFILWVRIAIGLVALGGGGYYLREYFVNKDAACKVTGGEKRRAVFAKLKNITQQQKFILALAGIIALAFAVNLVELICSAGLPVVFTQVLSLSNLVPWQRYAYMLLYIIVFMLDDMFVFFTAMVTLEISGINSKYTRLSHLIGGGLMVIIGLLLILKPEVLMFG